MGNSGSEGSRKRQREKLYFNAEAAVPAVLQGGAHLGEAALCLREVSRVFGASPPAVSASDNG